MLLGPSHLPIPAAGPPFADPGCSPPFGNVCFRDACLAPGVPLNNPLPDSEDPGHLQEPPGLLAQAFEVSAVDDIVALDSDAEFAAHLATPRTSVTEIGAQTDVIAHCCRSHEESLEYGETPKESAQRLMSDGMQLTDVSASCSPRLVTSTEQQSSIDEGINPHMHHSVDGAENGCSVLCETGRQCLTLTPLQKVKFPIVQFPKEELKSVTQQAVQTDSSCPFTAGSEASLCGVGRSGWGLRWNSFG